MLQKIYSICYSTVNNRIFSCFGEIRVMYKKRWNFDLLLNVLEKLRRTIVQCTLQWINDEKLLKSMENYKTFMIGKCTVLYHIQYNYKGTLMAYKTILLSDNQYSFSQEDAFTPIR